MSIEDTVGAVQAAQQHAVLLQGQLALCDAAFRKHQLKDANNPAHRAGHLATYTAAVKPLKDAIVATNQTLAAAIVAHDKAMSDMLADTPAPITPAHVGTSGTSGQ